MSLLGGGGWGVLCLMASAIMVLFVFFLCFKYGTKNITKSDTVTLFIALLAMAVWWQTKDPVYAIIMVTVIDALGYIPTYRKSYAEPQSETPHFWFLMGTVMVLVMLSNTEYSLLTMLYISVLAVANFGLFILLIIRLRKSEEYHQ